jgi:hypothetical protein
MMDNRMRVLEMIESGEISVAEGARRLEDDTAPAGPPSAPVALPTWVGRLWHVVFWPGVALLIGGGLLLTYHYAGQEGAGSLVTGWVLFALGVLVTALGAWLQSAHWFSVRIREHGKRRITLAFPLPLRPLAWLLRVISPFVPQLRDTGVDEVLLALRDEMRQGHPFIVDVDEGDGREQVQVYFA